MNLRIVLIAIAALFTVNVWGQTNTFPPTGNVGIGTISSSASLEIRNPVTNFAALKIGPSGNSHSYVYIDRHDGKDGGILLTEDGKLDYQLTNLDNRDFIIYSYSKKASVFNIQNTTGNVGIGTTNPDLYKLAVKGKIGAHEIVVTTDGWSDFVFNSDYKLKPLDEVESFIEENNHLPDVPSEKEVMENGIALGEMDAKLLQKIEELTLYMIQQNKETKKLIEKVETLESKNVALESEIKKLKSE